MMWCFATAWEGDAFVSAAEKEKLSTLKMRSRKNLPVRLVCLFDFVENKGVCSLFRYGMNFALVKVKVRVKVWQGISNQS